jgi:hypothetical protein
MMDDAMILQAMDRIEDLLKSAADKAIGTWDIQHDINNARQIAKSVKVLVDRVGLPATESEKETGRKMDRERHDQSRDSQEGKVIVLKALGACFFAVGVVASAIIVAAVTIRTARILCGMLVAGIRGRWSKRLHAWIGRCGI